MNPGYAFSSVMAELHENMNKDSQELQAEERKLKRRIPKDHSMLSGGPPPALPTLQPKAP